MNNTWEFSGEKSLKWPLAEKRLDRKSKRIRQKTREEVGKRNDNPEIPDWEEPSDIHSLPLGVVSLQSSEL